MTDDGHKKQTVLYVIDSLAVGGAEILFVNLLPELSQRYRVVVVTLYNKIDFPGVENHIAEHISLGYKGYPDIYSAALRLKKIIHAQQPLLVHTHLYWSTIIGRIGCPKNIPFYFTVHATLDDDSIPFYKRSFIRFVEQATYRKYQCMIGVTQAVINTFKKLHRKTGATILLYNYVRDEFFGEDYHFIYEPGHYLRLVAVNNLRLIKNVPYLIETMKMVKDLPVTLDVYGEGDLLNDLIAMIESYGLKNVRLMGKRSDIHKVITGYDVFVSASTVEGFGISVAEAMATGLPVVLSSIPVYREIARENALYINNHDPSTLAKLIREIISGTINLQPMAIANREYAQMKFSKSEHLQGLQRIYQNNGRS
ncbi:MAG: glycosyltransferase family 4 protein [Flavisolibacter sp.]